MARALARRRFSVLPVSLVDRDPIALAAANAVASTAGVAAHAQVADLVNIRQGSAMDLRPLVGTGVDIVEMLGLFEYLPDAIAVDLLRQARQILRPGGVVIVGNMLDKRPNQTFFQHVIRWPRLHQRSIDQVCRLVAAAGLDPTLGRCIVPSGEGVYGVYALRDGRDSDDWIGRNPLTNADSVGVKDRFDA